MKGCRAQPPAARRRQQPDRTVPEIDRLQLYVQEEA